VIKIDDNTTVSDLLKMYVESKAVLQILDELGVDESTELYKSHKADTAAVAEALSQIYSLRPSDTNSTSSSGEQHPVWEVVDKSGLTKDQQGELEKTFDIIQSVAIRSGVGLGIFNIPTLRLKQLYDATQNISPSMFQRIMNYVLDTVAMNTKANRKSNSCNHLYDYEESIRRFTTEIDLLRKETNTDVLTAREFHLISMIKTCEDKLFEVAEAIRDDKRDIPQLDLLPDKED